MNDEKFTFFLRGPLSQWYKSPFTGWNIDYNCCEQYMMAQKALLFEDTDSFQKIMAAGSPRQQKILGRKVTPFDQAVWEENRYNIVYRGNYLKFTQNPELWRVLKDTDGTTLVEVNAKDNIWGIGLSETDDRRFDRNQWRGQNLLGQVLTELRTYLFETRT